MTLFTGNAILVGSNEKKSSVTWILQDIVGVDLPDEFNTAQTRIGELAADLAVITNSEIAEVSIKYVISESGVIPANADVFEIGQLVAALNNAGQAKKTGIVNVPAPVIGIFTGTIGTARDVVDLNDVDLQAYITKLSTYCTISDGETIKLATATNGLYSGRRVIKSRRLG